MGRKSLLERFMTPEEIAKLQEDYFQALVNLSNQEENPVRATRWRYAGTTIDGKTFYQSCSIVKKLKRIRGFADVPGSNDLDLRRYVPKMLRHYIEQGKVSVRKEPKLGRFYHATLEDVSES